MSEVFFDMCKDGHIVPLSNPFDPEVTVDVVIGSLVHALNSGKEPGCLFHDGAEVAAPTTTKLGELVGKLEYKDNTGVCLAWKRGQTILFQPPPNPPPNPPMKVGDEPGTRLSCVIDVDFGAHHHVVPGNIIQFSRGKCGIVYAITGDANNVASVLLLSADGNIIGTIQRIFQSGLESVGVSNRTTMDVWYQLWEGRMADAGAGRVVSMRRLFYNLNATSSSHLSDIYVRAAYDEIFDGFIRNKTKEGVVVITGTPGIGKTILRNYFVARQMWQIKQSRTTGLLLLTYSPHESSEISLGEYCLMVEGSVVLSNRLKGTAILDLFGEHEIPVFIHADISEGDGKNCGVHPRFFSVIYSSPNENAWKRQTRTLFRNRAIVYLPSWNVGELVMYYAAMGISGLAFNLLRKRSGSLALPTLEETELVTFSIDWAIEHAVDPCVEQESAETITFSNDVIEALEKLPRVLTCNFRDGTKREIPTWMLAVTVVDETNKFGHSPRNQFLEKTSRDVYFQEMRASSKNIFANASPSIAWSQLLQPTVAHRWMRVVSSGRQFDSPVLDFDGSYVRLVAYDQTRQLLESNLASALEEISRSASRLPKAEEVMALHLITSRFRDQSVWIQETAVYTCDAKKWNKLATAAKKAVLENVKKGSDQNSVSEKLQALEAALSAAGHMNWQAINNSIQELQSAGVKQNTGCLHDFVLQLLLLRGVHGNNISSSSAATNNVISVRTEQIEESELIAGFELSIGVSDAEMINFSIRGAGDAHAQMVVPVNPQYPAVDALGKFITHKGMKVLLCLQVTRQVEHRVKTAIARYHLLGLISNALSVDPDIKIWVVWVNLRKDGSSLIDPELHMLVKAAFAIDIVQVMLVCPGSTKQLGLVRLTKPAPDGSQA
jgi:hypothetical protein